MSGSLERQTSAFMNANAGSFQDVTTQPDAASGGRLLSTSGENKRPSIRMTQPAKRRIRLMAAIVIAGIVLAAVIVIIAVTTSKGSQDDSAEPENRYKPHPVPHFHVRCLHDVIVAEKDSSANWRHYDSKAHIWKTIPSMNKTGFVIISPRYKLEAGYPGVMVSMLLPHNNTRFHILAVTSKHHHTKPVFLATSSSRCESVILDDPDFFDGDEKEFRVYVFYKTHMHLHGIKFTVSSLPLTTRFASLTIKEKFTTQPEFVRIDAGHRDVCSVEIKNGERHCNWWNVRDGDNMDFQPSQSSSMGCIDGGVKSRNGDVWFLAVEPRDDHHESRALFVSPIVERKKESAVMTLWYMFKCEGTHLRIHRIPAGKASFRHALSSSSVVIDVSTPASHSNWKFLSFQIPLPKENTAYHFVLEGVVPRQSNCTNFRCMSGGNLKQKQPDAPILGLDSLTIELMHEQCEPTNKSSAMDCKFQTKSDKPTMCEWKSSLPPGMEELPSFPGMAEEFQDWKAVNSGDDNQDNGVTSQHFEGRGYIMSFDASGKSTSEAYVRTPPLVASNNCSCVMNFFYLMRGPLTSRMQVNIVYAIGKTQTSEPQWSLFGHQDENWMSAVIPLNLKTGRTFRIEIRVLDVNFSQGDVHFDDLHFTGCDMEKVSQA